MSLIQKKDFFFDAIGLAVAEPYEIIAKTSTIYDLASLTKPLVVGLICAKLIQKGELKLDASISSISLSI